MNANLDKSLHEVAALLDRLATCEPERLLVETMGIESVRARLLEAYDAAKAEERRSAINPDELLDSLLEALGYTACSTTAAQRAVALLKERLGYA